MALNCIVLVVKKDILLLNYYNTMSLSLKNIKRWYLMLTGQSIYHVNQSLGLYFSEKCIRGYYNNMMQKVLMDSKYVYSDLMPSLDLGNGQKFFSQSVYFSMRLDYLISIMKVIMNCICQSFANVLIGLFVTN